MFAVYCQKPSADDPMSGLVLGDRPEPKIPEGWVRVKVSHASLNRHDIFTPRGLTSHAEGITYPMILGNDGAGTLDDGTPVVIYPVMDSDDWRGDVSARDAQCSVRAWLTAYRPCSPDHAFSPVRCSLVQGASGGMSTAL